MELLVGIVALVLLGAFWRQAVKGGAIIAGVAIGGSLILILVLTVIWVGQQAWNFAADAINKNEKRHAEAAATSPARLSPPGFNPFTALGAVPVDAPTASHVERPIELAHARGASVVDGRGVPIVGASVTYAEFQRRGCHIDLSKTETIGPQEFVARDWAGQEGKPFGVATALDVRDLRFFICSPAK